MYDDQPTTGEAMALIPPGPELAARLEATDRRQLEGYDRVWLLRARARQIAHLQAELYADMVAISDSQGTAGQYEGAADEIRAALAWTRRAADRHVSLAVALVEHLPQVWQALQEGRIDLPRAQTIIHELGGVESEVAGRVADIVVRAPRQTASQMAARIRGLLVEIDPPAAAKRYRHAVKERRLELQPCPVGTTHLYATNLPADEANAAYDYVDQLARSLRTREEPRSLDQLRTDVFLDLLQGRQVGAPGSSRRGVIDLRIDLTTLAGLNDRPAEIPGYGPVIAEVGRRIAERQSQSEWRVTVIDPDDQQPVWTGTTRRRPTAAQRRAVTALNPTCVFPGCRRPASRSQIDHNQPWSRGGPTINRNLAPLCEHDHPVKDQGGWLLRRVRPGTYRWTSPLGHQYLTTIAPP